MDPFRGELTAGYVHEDNLRWAARERLIRQSRPKPDVRTPARWDLRRVLLGFLPAPSDRRSTLKA